MKPSLIRDILIFGKLNFAVAPFLSNSLSLAGSYPVRKYVNFPYQHYPLAWQ